MMASGDGPLAANATQEINGSAAHATSIRVFNTGVIKATSAQQELAVAPGLPWSRPSPAALTGVGVMGARREPFKFTPMEGRFHLVRGSARTVQPPCGPAVRVGELTKSKRNTHPKNIYLSIL